MNVDGLQCASIRKIINRACLLGRVDVVIQSTDKNFMVPVGGAIIAVPDVIKSVNVSKPYCGSKLLKEISSSYAGRASMSPILDLLITFLCMGEHRLLSLLTEREVLFRVLTVKLGELATKHGERLLIVPNNHISVGISLFRLFSNSKDRKSISQVGAKLFVQRVSGARVVLCGFEAPTTTNIHGYDFLDWGSHFNAYPVPYLTAASGIGMSEQEIFSFVRLLDRVLTKLYKEIN